MFQNSQNCFENTYTNHTGSTECGKCPNNKVSIRGSSNEDDCVCDIGFYRNPRNSKECFSCPVGGICNSVNLSIPIAKFGYWYSTKDINSFYSCYPKESCGGGGNENCSNF